MTKENHPDLHPGDKACEEWLKEANEVTKSCPTTTSARSTISLATRPLTPTRPAAAWSAAASETSAASVVLGDIFGDIFGFWRRFIPESERPHEGENVRGPEHKL